MENLQNSIERAWHSITEGWQHFYQRCKGSLTYFDKGTDVVSTTGNHRLSWSLLNTDIVDHDDYLLVSMEVAGLEKEDINIEINQQNLKVSGTKKFEEHKHEGDYHMMECAYGSFQRTFTLPSAVDRKSVDAQYKNGVLKIKMNKISPSQKINIEIK